MDEANIKRGFYYWKAGVDRPRKVVEVDDTDVTYSVPGVEGEVTITLAAFAAWGEDGYQPDMAPDVPAGDEVFVEDIGDN